MRSLWHSATSRSVCRPGPQGTEHQTLGQVPARPGRARPSFDDGVGPGDAHLLDVEPGLDPAQHDVVDPLLVAQLEQGLAPAADEGERRGSCTGRRAGPPGRRRTRTLRAACAACPARAGPARPPVAPVPSSAAVASTASMAASRVNSSASWTSSATEVSTGSRANRTTAGSSSACSRVSTITPQVIRTIRSRSGNGAPESRVCGTASTAASETAPRKPAIALTVRCRAPTRRAPLGRAAVDEPDQVRRGVGPHPPHPDHDDGHHERVDQRAQQRGAGQVTERGLRRDADQHEQRTAQHRGGERPERAAAICRVAAPVIRGATWLMNSPQDDDRQHAGRVDGVGQQERRERGHQHGDRLEHRVVHPAAQLPAEEADQPAGEHASAVGQHEQPGDVPAGQLLLTDGDADRQPVEHQRGAVVDQALGAQHGHRAPRQVAGQDADRGRVGRGERGTEHPGRPHSGRRRVPPPRPRPPWRPPVRCC